MGTPSKVTFKYSDGPEAFSFTTDNSGHIDSVGRIIANTIQETPVTCFLRLATNVLAHVSKELPKRTAIIPPTVPCMKTYLRHVAYEYIIQAGEDYEDISKEVKDVIVITVNVYGEEVFKGTAKELLQFESEEVL